MVPYEGAFHSIKSLKMSFLNGLKRVEQFLTNVADAITPEYDVSLAQHQSHGGYSRSVDARGAVLNNPSSHSFDQVGNMLNDNSTSHLPVGIDLPPREMMSMSNHGALSTHYSDMLNMLRCEILATIIPTIPDRSRQTLMNALREDLSMQAHIRKAQRELEQCRKKQEQEQKEGIQSFKSEEATNEAQANLESFQAAALQTKNEVLAVGIEVLSLISKHFDGMNVDVKQQEQWKMKVLQATILTNATPQQLVSYASSSHSDIMMQPQDHIYNLLQDSALMKEILLADGPKGQKYAYFLKLYHQICTTSRHTKYGKAFFNNSEHNPENTKEFNIFDRLALAVALEHADPMKIFDTNETIDPISRYIHYEKAYLKGELDPAFSMLSTWELRMVVNNDASDDEIQWCRDMLRNYRPDHILDRKDEWRYCMIVRSDVEYKRPVWKKGCPRTYKQMISGGGMCGPRAWFGRYACKSFGIPTWGVRQPGHAAMSHWTPSGEWVIKLGGSNWKKSWWEDRNGVDFHLETQARLHGKEYEQVLWLQCLAHINGEVQFGSQNAKFYKRQVESRFWSELSMIQKEIFAMDAVQRDFDTGTYGDQSYPLSMIEALRNDSDANFEETIVCDRNGCITIPASFCMIIPKNKGGAGNVIKMKCFHGGKQIHARDGATFEYQVQVSQTRTYLLSLSIVTVHSQCEAKPLQVATIHCCHDIEIQYSEGKWAKTKPVPIHFSEGMVNKLTFKCPPGLRVTIKDFTLTPSIPLPASN